MDDVRLGRVLRALRVRRGLSQAALAGLVGISQQTVSLIERGHLETLSIRIVRRAFAAVEARFDAAVSWRGAALDRLLDERHARLVDLMVRDLRQLGWEVAVEVSFNQFGDRASIDILALKPSSGVALVIEVHTELSSVEETIRRLDVKVRLASRLVEERFGRRPIAVGRLLVLPRSTTTWRRIRLLAATLDTAFPDRGIACRQWLKAPSGSVAGLLLVPSTNRRG